MYIYITAWVSFSLFAEFVAALLTQPRLSSPCASKMTPLGALQTLIGTLTDPNPDPNPNRPLHHRARRKSVSVRTRP